MTQIRFLGYEDSVRLVLSPKAPPAFYFKIEVDEYNLSESGSGSFLSRGRGGGACSPPPPVAAPLVPRCALLPAATPRDVLSALGMSPMPIRLTPKGRDAVPLPTTRT